MPQITYLNVPFAQKDAAKALGARWDSGRRQWYVAAEDLTPFQRWLSAPGVASPLASYAVTPDAPATGPVQGMSLHAFLEQIQRVVREQFLTASWVRVEVNSVRANQGHRYLELVEHDAAGQLIAKIDAVLWKQQAALLTRFEQETGVEFTEGIKLLVSVVPQFNPRYGLKLDILDIDPAYTLGDMAAKLKRIRETLRAEGVYALNRRLPLPQDFFHVAVISPVGAASLGDFRAEATRLQRYGLCRFSYFEALFQGPQAPVALLAALEQAVALHATQRLDAVVIIRGGGSVSDLFWLNDEALARAVCLCPLPVITGIGHEPDHTVLDEVATRKCDTPSKVAQLLQSCIVQTSLDNERHMQRIRDIAQRHLRQAERGADEALFELRHQTRRRLAALDTGLDARLHALQLQVNARLKAEQVRLARQLETISERARYRLQAGRERLDTGWRQLAAQAGARLLDSERQMSQARVDIHHHVGQRLVRAEHDCRHRIEYIFALGPDKTLRRGYAYLRQDGRILTRQTQVGDHPFTIHMQDGPFEARRTDHAPAQS